MHRLRRRDRCAGTAAQGLERRDCCAGAACAGTALQKASRRNSCAGGLLREDCAAGTAVQGLLRRHWARSLSECSAWQTAPATSPAWRPAYPSLHNIQQPRCDAAKTRSLTRSTHRHAPLANMELSANSTQFSLQHGWEIERSGV